MEKKQKIVFISGGMTGYEDYNRLAFYEAEEELRKKGYLPLNPAVLPTYLADKDYMPISIAMIEASDAIYVLRGWEDSLGSSAEVIYAMRQDKEILFQEGAYKGFFHLDEETE